MTDPEVPQTEKSSRSKAPLIVGGLVVVAIVVAGVFWLLRDDAPDEVNLDDAVAQVSTTTEAADTGDTGDTGSDDGSSTTGVAADGIEGEWTVDTETGEFDYESATGSFVGFRIDTLAFAGGAVHDPLAALVFCQPPQVDLSVINGRVRVQDGHLLGVDLPALVARHNTIARALARGELR